MQLAFRHPTGEMPDESRYDLTFAIWIVGKRDRYLLKIGAEEILYPVGGGHVIAEMCSLRTVLFPLFSCHGCKHIPLHPARQA